MFDFSLKLWNWAINSLRKNGRKPAIFIAEDSIKIKPIPRDPEKLNDILDEPYVLENYYNGAAIFVEGCMEEIELDKESLRNQRVKLTKKADAIPRLQTTAFSKFANPQDNNAFSQDTLNIILIAGLAVVGGILMGATL